MIPFLTLFPLKKQWEKVRAPIPWGAACPLLNRQLRKGKECIHTKMLQPFLQQMMEVKEEGASWVAVVGKPPPALGTGRDQYPFWQRQQQTTSFQDCWQPTGRPPAEGWTCKDHPLPRPAEPPLPPTVHHRLSGGTGAPEGHTCPAPPPPSHTCPLQFSGC